MSERLWCGHKTKWQLTGEKGEFCLKCLKLFVARMARSNEEVEARKRNKLMMDNAYYYSRLSDLNTLVLDVYSDLVSGFDTEDVIKKLRSGLNIMPKQDKPAEAALEKQREYLEENGVDVEAMKQRIKKRDIEAAGLTIADLLKLPVNDSGVLVVGKPEPGGHLLDKGPTD